MSPAIRWNTHVCTALHTEQFFSVLTTKPVLSPTTRAPGCGVCPCDAGSVFVTNRAYTSKRPPRIKVWSLQAPVGQSTQILTTSTLSVNCQYLFDCFLKFVLYKGCNKTVTDVDQRLQTVVDITGIIYLRKCIVDYTSGRFKSVTWSWETRDCTCHSSWYANL